jgi:hypothetical protein
MNSQTISRVYVRGRLRTTTVVRNSSGKSPHTAPHTPEGVRGVRRPLGLEGRLLQGLLVTLLGDDRIMFAAIICSTGRRSVAEPWLPEANWPGGVEGDQVDDLDGLRLAAAKIGDNCSGTVEPALEAAPLGLWQPESDS